MTEDEEHSDPEPAKMVLFGVVLGLLATGFIASFFQPTGTTGGTQHINIDQPNNLLEVYNIQDVHINAVRYNEEGDPVEIQKLEGADYYRKSVLDKEDSIIVRNSLDRYDVSNYTDTGQEWRAVINSVDYQKQIYSHGQPVDSYESSCQIGTDVPIDRLEEDPEGLTELINEICFQVEGVPR